MYTESFQCTSINEKTNHLIKRDGMRGLHSAPIDKLQWIKSENLGATIAIDQLTIEYFF